MCVSGWDWRPFAFAVAQLFYFLSVPVSVFAQFDVPPAAPPIIVDGPGVSLPVPDATISPSMMRPQLRSLEAMLDELRKQDPARADNIAQEFLGIVRKYQQQAAAEVNQAKKDGIASSKFLRNNPRVVRAQGYIDQLRASGGTAVANQLEARLRSLQMAIESQELTVPASDVPEVHQISLTSGNMLPAEYRTAANRLRTGYAEVILRHQSRPITLILSARTPILWKITAAPGVRVHAVILDSTHEQRITGLDNALVLATRNAHAKGLLFPAASRQSGQFDLGQQLAGGPPVTHYVSDSYAGTPIVVGKENEAWLDAYLVPAVEKLISQARHATRQRHALPLRELKFNATFSHWLPSFSAAQACVAEFSLVGPIAKTIVPLSIDTLRQSITVIDEERPIEFGLTRTGQLVTVEVDGATTKTMPVPLSSEVFPTRPHFRSLTYDAKRHRLLLAAKRGRQADIVVFDVKAGEWSKLASFEQPVIGMTHIPAEDRLWSMLSHYSMTDQVEYAEFVVSDAETGVVISRQMITQPVAEKVPGVARSSYPAMLRDSLSHLVEADGRAVLVCSRLPSFGNRRFPSRPEMLVIEPKSGDLLYASTMKVNNGEDPLQLLVEEPASQTMMERTSLLNRVDLAFVAAKRALRQSSDIDRQKVSKLSARLETAAKVFRGEVAKSDQTRLYLVGRHSATQPVTIRVADTSGPVVLAVCGQQPINWKIEAAEGVQLTRIIVAGNLQQTVSSCPNTVPVDTYFGKDGFAVYDSQNPSSLKRVEKRLLALTNLKISATSLAHRSNDLQIVGPQDGAMRLQLVKHELDAIQALANTQNHRDLVSLLDKKRFYAIHQGPLPRSPATANREPRYWNEFSIRGPLIGRSIEISNQTKFAAQDQVTNRLFLVSNSILSIRDLDANTTEEINLRQKAAGLGQVSGVSFDAKQSRVLIDSSSGLFAYDLKSKQVGLIRGRKQISEAGFAYAQSKSLSYAAQFDQGGRGEIRKIRKYNEHGAVLGTINLSKPFPLTRFYGSGNTLQLIDLDEHLALLNYRSEHEVRLVNGKRSRRPLSGRIMVLAVATGAVVHESTIQPTLEPRAKSQAELASNWERLADEDLGDLDSVMWSMAAGGNTTYDYLLTKYAKKTPSLDAVEITLLLKDLDDNRFSVRNQAFNVLQEAGSSIEMVLKQFIETPDTSSEVRERLRSLLEHWSSGQPQTDEERRQVRGLEVLFRIGNQEAKEFLATVRDGEYNSVIRHYAAEILDAKANGTKGNPALQFQRQLFVPRR